MATGAKELERSFWMALEEILGLEQVQRISEHTFPLSGQPFCSLMQIMELQKALEAVYGIHAGQGLALRSGRAWVKYGLRFFRDELGWNRSEFRLLPRPVRIQRGLEGLASWMDRVFMEKFFVTRSLDGWLWQIHDCPLVIEPGGEFPCCYWMIGVLEETLQRLGDGKIYLVRALPSPPQKAPVCLFEIPARSLGD
jgi:hypothetical protein